MKVVVSTIHFLFGAVLILYGAVWGFWAETEEDVGTAVALIGIGLAILITWVMVIIIRALNRMHRTVNAHENCCSAVEFILTPLPLPVEEESDDFCQSAEG